MYVVEKFYPEGFNPQQYWDDRYAQEHIAGRSSEAFRKQGFWPLLRDSLEKDKKYLDAGCGVGGWMLFLREEGYDVEGIDVASRVVRAITEYDPDAPVKIAGMTMIPYANASLDGVLAIGVLEYIEGSVPTALREAHRVLRDDGLLFLEVPAANTLRKLFYLPLKKVERFLKGTVQGKHATFATYLFDRNELVDLLHKAGFEVEEMKPHELPASDGHYGLYVDWKIFRGGRPYTLNPLGLFVKWLCNAISPWIASTGIVVTARKV